MRDVAPASRVGELPALAARARDRARSPLIGTGRDRRSRCPTRTARRRRRPPETRDRRCSQRESRERPAKRVLVRSSTDPPPALLPFPREAGWARAERPRRPTRD